MAFASVAHNQRAIMKYIANASKIDPSKYMKPRSGADYDKKAHLISEHRNPGRPVYDISQRLGGNGYSSLNQPLGQYSNPMLTSPYIRGNLLPPYKPKGLNDLLNYN